MMKTILAAVAALGLATAATAQTKDFDDLGVTVSAQTGIFTFEVEGSANAGYTSATVGAEVLSYNIGAVNSTVDVFGTYYRSGDDFGIGAVYTATYAVDAWRVYGSVEAEYLTRAEDVLVTPTVGAGYTFNPVLDAFAEVSHTWVANDSWARAGGVAEVGLNIGLADNVTLTPSVRHNFVINGGRGDTQAHVGLNFRF
jgi:hypothetical protein